MSNKSNTAPSTTPSSKKSGSAPIKINYAEIIMPALILTAICATATLILALTNLLTQGRIAENAAEKAADSRRLVLEAADYTQLDEAGKVYSALDFGGEQIGVIVITEAKGYGGKIQVMTGIRKSSGTVSGVTILSMEETPGLGARTGETNFLSQFIGAKEPNLAVFKDDGDIDAVSGATISSRAVTQAVNEAIEIAADYLSQ